jgi:hypothetical protein
MEEPSSIWGIEETIQIMKPITVQFCDPITSYFQVLIATYDRHIAKNEQSNLLPKISSNISCCDILIRGNV